MCYYVYIRIIIVNLARIFICEFNFTNCDNGY